MSTNFSDMPDATLAKLCDAITDCIRSRTGTVPAAGPNAFRDRMERAALLTGVTECSIEIKVNPGGTTAWARVTPINAPNGAESIQGTLDLTLLAAKLA